MVEIPSRSRRLAVLSGNSAAWRKRRSSASLPVFLEGSTGDLALILLEVEAVVCGLGRIVDLVLRLVPAVARVTGSESIHVDE